MSERTNGAAAPRRAVPWMQTGAVALFLALVPACSPQVSEGPPRAAVDVPADVWSAAQPISAWSEGLGPVRHRLADVATDGEGRVHALLTLHAPQGTDAEALYYAVFDGRTGRQPVPLREGGPLGMPRLVADSAGHPHALWYEKRGVEAPTILVYRTHDGRRWSPPAPLYRETERGGLPVPTLAAAVGCDGVLHVVHASTRSGLVHRARTAGGWAPPVPMDQPALTPAWSAGPCPGSLHLAYMAAGAGPGRGVNQLFTRSLRGARWGPLTHLYGDGGRYSHYPVLLRDGTGLLNAVWLQDTDGTLFPEALYHATSRDGVHWTEGRDITPAALRGGVFWMVRGTVDGAGRPHVALRFSHSARPDDSGAYTLRLQDGRWSAPATLVSAKELGEGEVHLAASGRNAGVRAVWKARDGRYLHAELAGPGRLAGAGSAHARVP